MSRFVTFGEIMMRLNPEGYGRFVQSERLEASYAGGEANVAVSLANYGQDVSFVTKLPSNPLGEAARNAVRRFGVETGSVVWGGPRLGLYFVEKGAAQRASKVVYDRAGSSIALARRGDFDWARILKGAKWFHFTGITPALGGDLPAICLDALKFCKTHRITVSCDLNYRGKLWTREEAGKCMAKLVPYVDVLIANAADAADVFGIVGKGSDVESGKLDKAGYVSVAEQLVKRIRQVLSAVGPGIFAIGYTIGTGSVTSMAKAGADYGLGLLWVLALSCLFSGVLMTAYGRFAVVFFMVGTLAAGLSSVFPILMVAPLLVGDWRDGQMETKTPLFMFARRAPRNYGVSSPTDD